MEHKITKIFLIFSICTLMAFASEKEVELECVFKDDHTCVAKKELFDGKNRMKFTKLKTAFPKSGKKAEDVNSFIVEENAKIVYIPNGVHDIFKNITKLTFTKSGLIHLAENDFKDFDKLDQLYLDENNITEVPAKIFDKNIKLVEIYLNKNKIIKIDPHVFDKLTELKKLLLDSKICDISADTNATSKDLVDRIKDDLLKSKCKNGGSILYLNTIILSLIALLTLKI
ncbi:hypothetical protein PVAND_014541 [Polypedilum vanderplanki]|uniref:Leucine-rich repeat protein n=1 Tax=Polypedilum vanderplanki TaxID=319348 RepID=A0A9J6BAA8_POLVA|nr:hypothetical protein PVAND_014541 [Polypedilum vanderplanki]